MSNLHTGAAGLSAGNNLSCVLDQGQLLCWGFNGYGQIGDGTTTSAYTATAVSGLSSGVDSVAVGTNHACAVTTSGTVKCWGDNQYGQLGSTGPTSHTTPLDVPGLSDVSSLVVGNNSTCAILTDGSVKCWGSNAGNQLGINTAFTSTPTAPIGFNVAAVAADTVTLASGVVGTAYSSGPLTATGGVAPYTWTATGLPDGLSVSSAGVLSGSPTEAARPRSPSP